MLSSLASVALPNNQTVIATAVMKAQPNLFSSKLPPKFKSQLCKLM
jgi:hypothetical protein